LIFSPERQTVQSAYPVRTALPFVFSSGPKEKEATAGAEAGGKNPSGVVAMQASGAVSPVIGKHGVRDGKEKTNSPCEI
jgi:hypothetical protein